MSVKSCPVCGGEGWVQVAPIVRVEHPVREFAGTFSRSRCWFCSTPIGEPK